MDMLTVVEWIGEAPAGALLALVPGVIVGAFVAACMTGELRFKGVEGAANMRRAMFGSVLMGFGGVVAGGLRYWRRGYRRGDLCRHCLAGADVHVVGTSCGRLPGGSTSPAGQRLIRQSWRQ